MVAQDRLRQEYRLILLSGRDQDRRAGFLR